LQMKYHTKDNLFYSHIKGYSISVHELHKQIKMNDETGEM
jgi:hypothetical protein